MEAEFAKLTELQAQEEAFAAELRKAESEADELLRDEDSPEKDLVKRVLAARALADVRRSRLTAAGQRVRIQVEDTYETAVIFRKTLFQVVAGCRSLRIASRLLAATLR